MFHFFSQGMKNSTRGHVSIQGMLKDWLTFTNSHPKLVLALIFSLGIITSIAVNLKHLPPAPNAGENDTWWAIALNLIHGHGYSLCLTSYFPFCGPANQLTAAREPLPVLLFAGVALVSHASLWAATFVELLIYLAILLVIYFLTREWANSRAALLAAFLWAIYIPAIELIPQVSGDLLAALFVGLGMLFTLRARRTRDLHHWLIAGINFGLAVLSRSGTLVVSTAVIGGLLLEAWRVRPGFRKIISPALILSSLIILI
ncbi:MAG TPA: glycosyltransferase family 39 protein, partial [Anaerolineales bacterium]|nr:glycosyltransferase family 39 protein [Anaerolineales bacterium]